MKKVVLFAMLVIVVGCSSFKPKKTKFYKDNKLVKTFVGRGIFDGNERFGIYKVWALNGWAYYQFTCEKCTVVETPIQEQK